MAEGRATGDPDVVRLELPVGDATMSLELDEIRTAISALSGSTE